MKMTEQKIKLLLSILGFAPEEGTDNIYIKSYSKHNNYSIRVNFISEKINYVDESFPENKKITLGDLTTSNFSSSENFVVLECVNRLLEKGYSPQSVFLEYKHKMGHEYKGKLDITIFDKENHSYLMIECKTWESEYSKEQKKMIKDGGQLFSYYAQDRDTKFLCLYTSSVINENIAYLNSVIKVDDEWRELSNVREIHDYWNKNFKDNGIFEEWSEPYDAEIKALTRGQLKELTETDSGLIFNQFAEILRHNVISDKPNAFNKILNLFICKIYDENKNANDEVEFQWKDDDTDIELQKRLNDLYKEGMQQFLDIDVTDYSENEIEQKLGKSADKHVLAELKEMFLKLRLQKNSEFAFIEVYNDQSFTSNARVVKEVVELLQPYVFRYGHKQQFLGDFFELLLNTSIKQESGQFFTPVPIARYIINCMPIQEFISHKMQSGDSQVLPIAIDYATGSGHFLTEYMDYVQNIVDKIDTKKSKPSAKKNLNIWKSDDGKFEWARDYVYGIEADYRLVKTTKVSSFLNGDGEANIMRANGLDSFSKSKDFRGKLKQVSKENNKDNSEFDILIANPPYSVSAFKSTIAHGNESFELYDYLTDSSSEIECLFIERTKQLLKVGGWAGVILPSSILSNTGIYTHTRELILKYFKIIGITEFGSNTFMATGTNTVTLFLERRDNTDCSRVEKAVDLFFENFKDVAVLGHEKPFTKYVESMSDNIKLSDYKTFLNGKSNEAMRELEIFKDYCNWFADLTEIKNLKNKKKFLELSSKEQEQEIKKLFYQKVLAIEKDKLVYFILALGQNVVIVKTGEKQEEKAFLGYEFSNRRGHEGIRMLPNGTKLYSSGDILSKDKANSYIYNAFLGKKIAISDTMKNNVGYLCLIEMLDFNKVSFEKNISINTKKKFEKYNQKYRGRKLGANGLINIYDNIRKPITKRNRVTGIYPYYGATGIIDYIDDYIFDGERVLLGEDGAKWSSFEKSSFIASGKYWANNHVHILEGNPDILLNKYLVEILNALDLSDYITGQNVPKLNQANLFNIMIPLPPIDIQEKIIQEIEVIESLEINNKNKINEKKNKLLEPSNFNYQTQRLDKATHLIKRGKSAKYGTSNIQIIKSGQARGLLEFDFSEKHFVADGFVSDERNLQKGDLLINSTGVGTAGRVTLFDLDGDFVADSHITIVRLNKDIILPKYALYSFYNIGFDTIEKMATGQSGQIELNLSIIQNIQIPVPNIKAQIEIIEKIETLEVQIKMLEDEIKGAEEQKKSILDKYLM